MSKTPTPITLAFGRYLRALRTTRAKSQTQLGKASKLAADTISRLEQGMFSPSLDTLVKLVNGLGIDLEVFIAGFARDEVAGERELIALARSLSADERRVGLRILVVLAGLVGGVTGQRGVESSVESADTADNGLDDVW